ncbi:MAG: hypothetical protein HUU37_10990 [Bdellovibrionales bacterium]|nr:hypothetical protein [Bdellovibrionales bacterium]
MKNLVWIAVLALFAGNAMAEVGPNKSQVNCDEIVAAIKEAKKAPQASAQGEEEQGKNGKGKKAD